MNETNAPGLLKYRLLGPNDLIHAEVAWTTASNPEVQSEYGGWIGRITAFPSISGENGGPPTSFIGKPTRDYPGFTFKELTTYGALVEEMAACLNECASFLESGIGISESLKLAQAVKARSLAEKAKP